VQQLTNHNPQVAGWKLGKVQEISWTSSKDGRKIYGVLILPPDYMAGSPYKTIVHAHGGPFEAWQTGWLGTWYEWAQLLASHGYVVLDPNPRGSQGQGVAFQEANYMDWGGGDFQDVMDGIDSLVRQGIADPHRLGIGGWSYGGYMTSWAVTHTDRFKAAVAGAAVTDLYPMSTTTDISPSFLTEFFGNFAADRKIYDEHSAMHWIERCHTPTLVLHGAADERVPTFQGEELYHGLQLLGRESQLVLYPREPHIFTEREHEIDSLQRIVDWFDSHTH
jgi:dipeptidyl aminopeptidase/acylaminoacyl peptidase